MPNRMLRDWTASAKVNQLSVYAERFFTRLIMKADDYGCYYANASLLKSYLFPLIEGVRETDISRWMAECQKAGLIALYESDNKQYLEINDFDQRLRAKNRKFPARQTDDSQMTVTCRPEVEEEVEEEVIVSKATGGKPPEKVFVDPEKDLKQSYAAMTIPDDPKEAWTVVKEWITERKPQFAEPYVTAWNIFASFYSWPAVKKITDKRRQKFKVRIRESAFDFFEILNLAKRSEFLKSGSWFGFDWIIENESNYLKIIEGNYK